MIFIDFLYLSADTNRDQKFTCNSNSYLFSSSQTASYTGAYNISLKNATVSFIKNFGKSHINATGYNPKDDYIYGWEYGEGSNYEDERDPHLVRIDADFQVHRVSLIGNLPNTRFYLGDIDLDGIYYLANRHQPDRNANILQEIQRVDLNTHIVLPKITLDYSDASYIKTSDFAINPIDNMLYTVNALNNQLVRIDTENGKVTELGRVDTDEEPIGNTYSVINFFDKYGNFYFYTSNSQKIYKIDISDPNSIDPIAIPFTEEIDGLYNSGDGARCALAAVAPEPDDEDNATENACTLAFPGALNSTNDEIQINDYTKIYGTKNHTLITKTLSAKSSVTCDNAPCQKSGTLANKLSFTLDLGNGEDGDMILSDNQSLTISSNKAYTKFQTGQNNNLTINGNLTIKSQSDFYINQGSKITINGDVTIYADKFDANQANQFTINGSLKIIANIFYLNSGNHIYDIPSPDKFVVLAKDIIDINSQVDFKGLFYSDGDIQVNDRTRIIGAMTGNYIDVNDRSYIGYDANAVHAYCSPEKEPETHSPSHFNFWDVDESIDHQVIKTKIVDENITLTFASLNEDGTEFAESDAEDIKVALFTPNAQLTRWRPVILGNTTHLNITFTPEDFAAMNMQHKAFKVVKAFVKYKDANGTNNILTSSDSFAIRPARYKLIPYNPQTQLIAGIPVRFQIKALGATGIIVNNYNESRNVYDLNGSEIKSTLGCRTGNITIQRGDFYQGIADLNLTYDEVGILDLHVFEKEGVDTEFANIDKHDTSARYITSDTLRTARFRPAKLGLLNWEFHNGAGVYTFYSSDPLQMGALLDLDLKVTSYNDTVTQNFTSACYAEDVNVTVSFKTDINNWIRKPIASYLDSANARHDIPVTPLGIGTHDGQLRFLIEQSLFHAGQGGKEILINFERNASIARNPLRLTITKVSASLESATLEQNSSKQATFIYGRAYAPNQNVTGNKMIAKIFYEVYCNDCNRTKYAMDSFAESVDSIHWYILPSLHTTSLNFNNPGSPDYRPSLPDDMLSTINAVTHFHKTDRNHLIIHISKAPMVTKITYEPLSYLRYNIFNSSTQKHNFTAYFQPKSSTWGGKGTVGKTVDRIIGKRSAFDKIDW